MNRTPKRSDLTAEDDIVMAPIHGGMLVRDRNTLSGRLLQALLDDMDIRSGVYERLVQYDMNGGSDSHERSAK